MYSTTLANLYNITGDQLGAYFGYSICVSDVDGDGGDDIVVGAPLFSEFAKNDGSYETGRVYVYLKKEVRAERCKHLVSVYLGKVIFKIRALNLFDRRKSTFFFP